MKRMNGSYPPSDVNPARDEFPLEHRAAPVVCPEHTEPPLTRLIEQQAAKIPSHVFLVAALAAMALSLALEVSGKLRPGRFVGMWAGPLLIMGVYNKLVKVTGQD